MTRIDHSETQAHVSHKMGHYVSVLAILTMLTGCDYIDCKTKRASMNAENRKNADLGMIYFKSDKDSDPYYSVNVKKIRRGYALQAPLYEETGVLRAHFTVQRDKEFKNFVGVQSQYSF